MLHAPGGRCPLAVLAPSVVGEGTVRERLPEYVHVELAADFLRVDSQPGSVIRHGTGSAASSSRTPRRTRRRGSPRWRKAGDDPHVLLPPHADPLRWSGQDYRPRSLLLLLRTEGALDGVFRIGQKAQQHDERHDGAPSTAPTMPNGGSLAGRSRGLPVAWSTSAGGCGIFSIQHHSPASARMPRRSVIRRCGCHVGTLLAEAAGMRTAGILLPRMPGNEQSHP